MKNIRNAEKIDLNLALLRMLMCFGVILAHCWNQKGYDSIIFAPFKEIQILAAPVFMVLAFYFSASLYTSHKKSKLNHRMIRLLIPHIGWALIYWIIFFLIEQTPITELFWQIFTGSSTVLNPTMWFQVVLIIYTLLFWFLFDHLDEKSASIIIITLSLLCFILEFSGFNYSLFRELRFELKYTFGRLVELFPYAALGYLLKRFEVLKSLKKYRYPVLIISFLLLPLPYLVEFPTCKGLGYAGIIILYWAILMIVFFEMLPFEKLSTPFKKTIIYVTSYTSGIYCCHRLVFYLLNRIFSSISFDRFSGCILIYALSYLLCHLIDLIPNRKTKSLVS